MISLDTLLSHYMQLWWRCEGTFPSFKQSYSLQEQKKNGAWLNSWTDQISKNLENFSADPAAKKEWYEQIRHEIRNVALRMIAFEPYQVDFIENSGMIDASLAFVRMARSFDPEIRGEDIYQAGRNVMTCNFIQLLMGLPVEVTPSIFAYSMLYPYSDNYLDDPGVSAETKHSFNRRFQQRLQGEKVPLENQSEQRIGQLVSMIEAQWARDRYPHVYDSLLAIHAAQARSLILTQFEAAPYELDVLGISFEKGGTSVLADGYLVAGNITADQARYLYGYGAYTQLMDDLEDVFLDISDGRLTIFSQASAHWQLDGLVNRFIHFGRVILADLDGFDSESKKTLAGIMQTAIDPILVDMIGQVSRLLTNQYVKSIETHAFCRFRSLQKVRRKLARRKLDMDSLAAFLQTNALQNNGVKPG